MRGTVPLKVWQSVMLYEHFDADVNLLPQSYKFVQINTTDDFKNFYVPVAYILHLRNSRIFSKSPSILG
jgi:hypothetical protein